MFFIKLLKKFIAFLFFLIKKNKFITQYPNKTFLLVQFFLIIGNLNSSLMFLLAFRNSWILLLLNFTSLFFFILHTIQYKLHYIIINIQIYVTLLILLSNFGSAVPILEFMYIITLLIAGLYSLNLIPYLVSTILMYFFLLFFLYQNDWLFDFLLKYSATPIENFDKSRDVFNINSNTVKSFATGFIMVIVTVSLFIQMFVKSLKSLEYTIIKQNKRLKQEIENAEYIQTNFIIKSEDYKDITSFNFETYMNPADEVGGDYYNILYSKKTDNLIFCIGDVSGHGLIAGLFQLIVHNTITLLFKIYGDSDKWNNELVYKKLNDVLLYYNSRVDDEGRMMTFVIFQYKNNTLSYTGNHETVIKVNVKDLTIKSISLDAGFLLGIDKDIVDSTTKTEILDNLTDDELLIFYTDGLIEIRRQDNPYVNTLSDFIHILTVGLNIGKFKNIKQLKSYLIGYINSIKESNTFIIKDDISFLLVENKKVFGEENGVE